MFWLGVGGGRESEQVREQANERARTTATERAVLNSATH